ncbi:MAG: aspartate aminotransferase family protein, partial [Flavobacteriaceae bacterium]|nr:aspartate aminotransferase family protein [Flavobacteriaceae bacterium]
MSNNRIAPLEINKEEFKKIGYQLIDTIADFNDSFSERNVTSGKSPQELQKLLGNSPLPEKGSPTKEILANASQLLFNHSLFN